MKDLKVGAAKLKKKRRSSLDFFDPSDAGLREVIKYELTQVTGPLEFRITHLLEAIKGRAMIVQKFEKAIGKTGRGRGTI